MHMADALLAPGVAGVMYACSAVAAGRSVRKLNQQPDDKAVPVMGVMGAFVFAAQMINFTIPGTGSSGHLCGGMLLAAIVGPYAAFLTMIGVLLIQCLLFADGGLMALGANIWNMAFYGCFVGGLIWRAFTRKGLNRAKIIAASLIGCILSLQLGAFSVSVETLASGITALPFGAFLLAMQPIHLAIGAVEGCITAAVLAFLYEARPSLLWQGGVAAGEKQRLTLRGTLGVLAGAVATAVLQSSSATTVMAIGFVSARLMTLRQAIAVIFGANIGTTMTAQLMAFKLSDYIWLIVFVGFIVWFAAKDERVKNIGQTVFAFGLLFVGIDTMGAVMKPLAQSEVFLAMIDQVKDIPALGVAAGTVMTLVVQSSSATIAVLQSFASQPGPDGVTSVLGLQGSIPILLGDNIGTTITALLACIGQSRDAKRTAVAHSVFNVTGAFVFIWFVPLIAQFVQLLTPGPELDVIARQIANAHTTFNIVCTLLWLPFIGAMVKIVTFLVPGKAGEAAPGALVVLDDKILGQPVFAIRMFGEELQKYCDKVRAMLAALPEAIANRDAAALKALQADCAQVEAAESELANYAVELLSAGATSERQAAEISDLMFIVDAAGRIGSRCGEAAALYGERLSSKKPFSDEAREELAESAAMVADMYDAVLRFLSDGGTASEQVLDERRRQIVKRQSRARKAHFRRVGSRQCAPENKAVYNQLLLCLERAGNECSNLVEHGAELSMWGDALGADRPGSHDGGAPPVAKRSEAPVDELAEALA